VKQVISLSEQSELPVRDVQGYLYEGNGKEVSARLLPIAVAQPGTCSETLQVPRCKWRLELELDDDAGYRWLKYRETRLRGFDADGRTLR